MTIKRMLLVAVLMAGLAGTAFLAREAEGAGSKVTSAAEKFVASLTDAQKKKAEFSFDDKERTRWFFTPQQADRKPTRKGLPLSEMTGKQQELARALVQAGTSESGYKKAITIMSLESILADLEKRGAMVRDPQWYFFSVFGKPDRKGRWGWRVEGHHLSLNFTVDGDKIVSATPFFLGANPAEVKQGKEKGLRTLSEEMDRYRAMLKLLDEEQDKAARQAKLFPEIEEGKPRTNVGKPVGLTAEKMNEKQKAALMKLITGYTDQMPADVAAAELAALKKAGFDKVHFAYGGGDGTPGKPYSYRVQGPTFVIEFLNEQKDSAGNPANHIHSAWRNVEGDFGLAMP